VIGGEVARSSEKKFSMKTLYVATNFDVKLCKIRHLEQSEADIDAVNKLYVEQRVKTLMNQQKESNERLTSFEKDVRALQITSFSVWLSKPNQKQRRITMSGNERRRDDYERLTNNFKRFLNQQRTV